MKDLYSLHYNGSNSFLFVTTTKICQFKANNSEIKDYALCLSNTSKDFTNYNLKKKKKTGLKGVAKFVLVDFNPSDTNDILDIHKYLMRGT